MKNQNKTKYQRLYTLLFLFFVCLMLIFDRIAQAAPDTTPPTVISTSPANGASDVAVDSAITATFSERMDASTINTNTFIVSTGDSQINGTVSYNAGQKRATFTPSSNLSYSTTYTVTITTGVKDEAGNPMVFNYTWGFITVSATDTTPPTVSSTSPAGGASDVAVDSAITATFSERMDASAINTNTFIVSTGDSQTNGTVSYNVGQKKAAFTPSGNLSYSTTYTATITTGVKDEAGNAMASNYTWSFTTASATDTTPPTIISISPDNGATDVTISSVTFSATFNERMDTSTINTSTFTVSAGGGQINGTVSYNIGQKKATFTPSGNLSSSTTYTATITMGVKDEAGNAMAANFTWSITTVGNGLSPPPSTEDNFTITSTNPMNKATHIAIDTVVSATFSMLLNGFTVTPSTFRLRDGNSEVAGSVTTLAETALFTPSESLAYNTTYTAEITTGLTAANFAGTTLTSNYTWTFTAIEFITTPMVISTSPTNGETNVAINSVITATFDEPMDATTIDTSTFMLNGITGTVDYDGTTTTFTPSADLNYSTTYTATITTGVKDLNGNDMASDYTWSFTTVSEPDILPPAVISSSPIDGDIDVPVNSVITVTFSELMDASTITTETFTVNDGKSNISGTVSYDDTIATFTPSAYLDFNTKYTVITTGAKDLAGNAITPAYILSFTTELAPTVTPTLIPVTPLSTPTLGPSPTPTPFVCDAQSITVFPKKLKLKKKGSNDVTVTLAGEDNCPVEGNTVEAKIAKGKKRISVSPTREVTNTNGQAVFVITSKGKTGRAEVVFKSDNLKTRLKVKVLK